MNGRALAIGSGLLVTMTGTALLGSASAAADNAVRTPAASSSRNIKASVARPSALPAVDPAIRARSEVVARARFFEHVNRVKWLETIAFNEAAARARARANAPRTSSSGSGGNVLECIKRRESRGQYDVVNSSSGAAGAYQFMPGTWDNNARSAGRTDLVGVNPANASAADQDQMAQHLLATQGLRPWGGSCG
ncbi:MAG: transglycosylase family protein [Acidimicrobiia bacterium]|nr:transglycosylase family protein [Acidimicrobiia bacterium]